MQKNERGRGKKRETANQVKLKLNICILAMKTMEGKKEQRRNDANITKTKEMRIKSRSAIVMIEKLRTSNNSFANKWKN